MSDNVSCPLCEKPANVREHSTRDISSVHCQTCGSFLITREAATSLRSCSRRMHELSAFTRAATARDRKVMLTLGHISDAGDPKIRPVCIEEVLRGWFPQSVSARLDAALLNFARRSSFLGDTVEVNIFADAPLLFARNRKELEYTLEALKAGGLVADAQQFVQQPPMIYLTPNGWNRIAEIERGDPDAVKTQAFVAMWFGNDRDQFDGHPSYQWSRDAFLRGFKPGIEAAGYDARRIDLKEFNEDVTDEIIAEIRRSRFVVTDFTGHRAGVYFEAGFAKGLDLPVIFTCHSDEIAKAHFDTSHYNHIVWSDFAELAEKLEIRIVATIGEGPNRPTNASET